MGSGILFVSPHPDDAAVVSRMLGSLSVSIAVSYTHLTLPTTPYV